MNLVTAYLKSPLGILKLTCLFVIALVVALSSYSHFNSHWVYHSRMVNREEVPYFNISNRDKLTEFRNEYEECRYNSRLYTGISMLDSPEKVNGFGAREYESTPGNACPHPVMELFLVVTSISILIVSLISLIAISIWLPVMVSEDSSIKFYRILDMVLFGLATLFLFIGLVMFWYSTDNIWEWCSLKTSMVAFTLKSGGGGGGGSSKSVQSFVDGNGKRGVRLQHDDTVDIITGPDDNNYRVPAANNPVHSQYPAGSRNTIVIPTAGPPAVLYLTRAKRETQEIEVRFVGPDNNSPHSRSGTAFDMELQKIRQDQYMELCNVRLMTSEKYFAIAAAFIATILHAVTFLLIYKKCGKGEVNDLHAHDEEVHHLNDDFSKNSKRPNTGQELRPSSKNNYNDSDVLSDNYNSGGSHVKNENGLDNRSRSASPSPNDRTTFQMKSNRGNDEGSWQNESGQTYSTTQPYSSYQRPDERTTFQMKSNRGNEDSWQNESGQTYSTTQPYNSYQRPNELTTSSMKPNRANDEGSWQNESGQSNFPTQPHNPQQHGVNHKHNLPF